MFRYRNLAPDIYRQRLVIEGMPGFAITEAHIKDFLAKLSSELSMKTLISPMTSKSEKFGWAGWIHWESSGAHFYAWDRPELFYSVDIYTCKAFDPKVAVEFTRNYFKAPKQVSKSF